MQLETMKILVTGAASGMGRHFCLKLAEAGAMVAAADVNEDGLASLVIEGGGKIKAYTLNVADEDNVKSVIKSAAQDLGGLNGLVNNAGIFRDGLLVRQDRETGAVGGAGGPDGGEGAARQAQPPAEALLLASPGARAHGRSWRQPIEWPRHQDLIAEVLRLVAAALAPAAPAARRHG